MSDPTPPALAGDAATPAPQAPAATGALQFDTAEPTEPRLAAMACAFCGAAIDRVYHTVNGKPACSSCRAQLEHAPAGSLLKALLLGSAGGFAGWCVYFAILKLANYELAIVAILVGYLVGQGVHRGSASRGGRLYQVMAVLITYVAITASYLPIIAAQAADQETPAVVVWIVAEFIALIYPFASLNPIGLVILGVGLWQAWTINRRVELAVTGPHTVATPAEADPALA